MVRLPTPGADSGSWGNILNEYLSESHTSDGKIKPGAVTKSDVGLGNVNNTADADKPISAATQTALNTKLATADLDSQTATHVNNGSSATAAAISSSLDSIVEDKVLDELTAVAPGAVQDYGQRTTDFTTTNTSFSSTAAASLIGGLELTVTGTGRPVEIVFYCGSVRHSVANQWVGLYLVTSVNGGANATAPNLRLAAVSSPSTTVGRTITASWDVDTVQGTSYTFSFGVCGGAAGTSTLAVLTDPAYPMTSKARNH